MEMSINWQQIAKDLRKNVFILQEEGFTLAPLKMLIIGTVLLLKPYGVLNPIIPQLYTIPIFREICGHSVELYHGSGWCI